MCSSLKRSLGQKSLCFFNQTYWVITDYSKQCEQAASGKPWHNGMSHKQSITPLQETKLSVFHIPFPSYSLIHIYTISLPKLIEKSSFLSSAERDNFLETMHHTFIPLHDY
ncbi:hypothetical protein ABZP36_034887 [Zizania latifolia]